MTTAVAEGNAYETQRLLRIQENKERLATLGVLKQKTLLDSAFKIVKNSVKCEARKRKKTRTPPTRSSPRLSGSPAEYAGLSYEEDTAIKRKAAAQLAPRLTTAAAPATTPSAAAAAAVPLPGLTPAQAASRCNSTSRGSVYDCVAGITCHFCRQKKLCGEADCPRCATRNADATCIGKSECSRCGSGTGRFCRACLLVRYGQKLEAVRAGMEAGSWLCPHCYEDDHPAEGWICNSSICMTRRGMRPTGIAIYEAQAQGFASVAHLVAHQLKSGGGGCGNNSAGC